VLDAQLDGDAIPMILRHKDVRKAAKDWKSFTSDTPFRVPIPSEEKVRSVRQLPIETDPPIHKEYRKIVEPFFQRPHQPEYVERISALVESMLTDAAAQKSVEVVREFALPLQSRALTILLNVPEAEADTWISWGTHVFRDGEDGASKGNVLDDYIRRQLDRVEKEPKEDFFSALTQAEFQGRKLTRDEQVGFANLTFAGGRDTVINSVAFIIGHIGENPEILNRLREDATLVNTAAEEFVRYVSPLTHIGRTSTEATEIHGVQVDKDQRVSLCWASANHDETVFENPESLKLDRKPNPHVGFGFGAHNCLGARHARLIIRKLLEKLAECMDSIEVLDARDNVEIEKDYQRTVAYESLNAVFHRRQRVS